MPTNSQRSESQRRVESLTAALLRDRERPVSANTSNECFACGRAYMRRPVRGDDNPRFCSARCQDAFDDGFSSYDPNRDRALTNLPLSSWVVGETRYFEPVLRGSPRHGGNSKKVPNGPLPQNSKFVRKSQIIPMACKATFRDRPTL
jgi:hypothetical protein